MKKNKPKSGDKIKQRRESMRLTQRDLSQMSGVPLVTIKFHETGMRNCSYPTAKKYAAVFDCQPEDLL